MPGLRRKRRGWSRMKQMRFLPELASYLKENGCIHTVRKYHYSPLDTNIQVDEVGVCKRRLISHVSNKSGLELFVDKSGFDSVDAWWAKIRALNQGYVGLLHLYEVKIEKEEMK